MNREEEVMAMIRVGKYTQEGYVKGGGLKFFCLKVEREERMLDLDNVLDIPVRI